MNSGMEPFQEEKTKYCSGTLEFDVPIVEIEARVGVEYRGSFRMIAHTEENAVGNIYTTDYRISCSDKGFKGKDMEVPFIFDTTGMERGDVARGEFYIISNLGEYYLPYEVKIASVVMDSELGEIKNLFHFANLAKVNWGEALKCFCSEEFSGIVTGSNRQYLEAYKGLLENGRETGHLDFAMEQFLILIKKKQAVTFECLTEDMAYTMEEVPDIIEVNLRRNGWGYTQLPITVRGVFLSLEKDLLTEEDFKNDQVTVFLTVHKQKLHKGRNTAVLQFVSGENAMECRISIDASAGNENRRIAGGQSRQLTDCIMRLYLDYRTGKKPVNECTALAAELLEHVRGTNELMPALYQTHLKLLTGQMNEAVWLLKHAKRMMEGSEIPLDIYGYFLYLTSMSEGEDQKRAGELLDQYVIQYPDHFVLYWGYMHKENLQKQNPGVVYRKLKDLWEKGCFHPVLYLEAAMVILENPAVFSVMDKFEIQLLLFMDRYYLLAAKITEQVYAAAATVKGYHPVLVRLLDKYPIKDKKKMAKVMCLQYMRGNCKGKAAAGRLREGILEDCRITGLYEAYIRALEFDQSETLPEEVVRYFAFDSSLDESHLAYVYAKIIRQQEEIRPEYEERIRNFVVKQLTAGRIDENLAYLYRNVLMPEDMTEKMQEQLLELAFANELTVFEGTYKYCIVRHEGIRQQRKYLLKGGRGLVEIYSDQYTLLLEDENGFCHYRETGFEIQPLLGFERMKRLLKNCGKISFGEQFYQFAHRALERADNEEEFFKVQQNCRWLLEQDGLTDDFRRELSGSLMGAYGKWDMYDELDAFLQKAQARDFAGKDRAEFVSILCNRGFYEKAFDAASAYGYEKVDCRVLARLCQFVIEDLDGSFDAGVLKLAYRVFEQGKYTETMIAYLAEWFKGTVKQMRSVWKAAAAMEVPATAIAERILEQILFAGAYTADREKIFRYYCENEGRGELIRNYLSMRAVEYLVREEAVEDSVFEKMQKDMLDGTDFPMGAKLALLKWNSERAESLGDEERRLCALLLGDSLGADIYFPYYGVYTDFYPVLEVYGEKCYVEHHTEEASRVVIHYIMDRQGEEEGIYCKEEMTEIYPGIYQKDFRLFWGERLQYYVTQGEGADEQFVMSGSMEKGGTIDENCHGRFHLLNDIALSMELGDYDTADALMWEYAGNSFMIEKMLRIK